MKYALSIDVGGTKIAAGLVDRHGTVIIESRGETPRGSADEVIAAVVEIAQDLLSDASKRPHVCGIAAGAPGTVDFERGVVVYAPNLPLRDLPFKDRLTAELNLPVYVDNDANLATLGEAVYGAGKKARHLIMLTLGTGIGGGIVIDKRIYRGFSGTAGELGHLIISCNGGKPHDLEELASGTALTRVAVKELAKGAKSKLSEVLKRTDRLSGLDIAEAARGGDAVALAAFRHVSYWLGMGLATIANAFNPEMIIIGGGMADSADLFLEESKRILVETAIEPNGRQAEVVLAELENRAAILGGAALAFSSIEHL